MKYDDRKIVLGHIGRHLNNIVVTQSFMVYGA